MSEAPSDATTVGAERLEGRRIVLGVTGSIAAYKAPAILRLLRKDGADVEVVLSRSALEFVGAATFSGLNGKPPLLTAFDPTIGGELHVELAARSDLVLIAPASADVLARLASGRADDLMTAVVLCARCPVLVAPAMHPNMWASAPTKRAVRRLADDGVRFVGPVEGEVASGDVGLGRMEEPERIVEQVVEALAPPDLGGLHVVVTAGATAEPPEPVRTATKRSAGKKGVAIAARAAGRGARVRLIAGPVALPTPPGVERVDIESTEELRGALYRVLGPDLSSADALVMAAAVADYRPRMASPTKIQRTSAPLTLELVPNPDVLAELGERRRAARPVLVGFALETGDADQLVQRARDKLARKRVDLVVANRAAEALGRDDIRVVLVSADGEEGLGPLPKARAADRILDWVARRLKGERA
nr:MAG: bifunctional phosphopantothenoylcysteine decarboxylase/phosphopantothenate--cysteine ligase CoaBC [Pseudomonadota bacterium]